MKSQKLSSWPDRAIPVTTPAIGSGPTCSSVPLIVTSLDVDSDSPSDHHPGDPTLSSSKNEGSLDDSFSSSQAAGSSAADSKHILKDPSEDDFDVVKLISNGEFQISNKTQNNIHTLLYLPWDKNSYSTSFKSQKFLIWSAKRCVNIVNITKNIDSRTQIAL